MTNSEIIEGLGNSKLSTYIFLTVAILLGCTYFFHSKELNDYNNEERSYKGEVFKKYEEGSSYKFLIKFDNLGVREVKPTNEDYHIYEVGSRVAYTFDRERMKDSAHDLNFFEESNFFFFVLFCIATVVAAITFLYYYDANRYKDVR